MKNRKNKIDKEYLLKNFTLDEVKKIISKIMGKEVRKSMKKMNTDLIQECADWLIELNGIIITEEEMEASAIKIKQNVWEYLKLDKNNSRLKS
ncbi:MAG: hypothetical protein FWC41_02055 [Firmicutes bacterium]|nr:hypothetical protein [Bacillota bacterium]